MLFTHNTDEEKRLKIVFKHSITVNVLYRIAYNHRKKNLKYIEKYKIENLHDIVYFFN